MASVEELKAELKVAELEEKLREAKDTDKGPSKGLKEQLREARRAHRTLRETRPVEPGDVRPTTIEASTIVNTSEGGA